MCVAVPAKIFAINENIAEVDMSGVARKVGLDLVEGAKINDYVLIHAGYAIQIIDKNEALETLELFKELMKHDHDVS